MVTVPAAVGCRAAGAFFSRKSKLQTPRAAVGVVAPSRTGEAPGLFQNTLTRLLAEQYCASPRTRHSAPPRLYEALVNTRSSGSVVTCTVSVAGVPLTSLIVRLNVNVCDVVADGTTNVGLAVLGLTNVTAGPPVWSQAKVEANVEPVPFNVTVEVGTTPAWSGPALATGGADGSETVILKVSVEVKPCTPVTVIETVYTPATVAVNVLADPVPVSDAPAEGDTDQA